ncbi:protein kinase [Streptomyces sp. NPDC046374]|uniref:serine/threonine-protein kinase n=1 Tax=Streptomyces sp. NPDC046374 TaxID=3154917 RepID=UPI0033C7B0AE
MQVRARPIHPDLRLTVHDVAGRYRLDGMVGRGGAADVYEALDLRLRRAVAVKLFRSSPAGRPEAQCEQEGRLLARLRHPGLVTLYDSGRDQGHPYLVMELVRGTTLRRRIERAPLSPAETCRLGASLASALAHVHARGVVHRDVKPSNIILDGADAPHLVDFGIARPFGTADGPAPADHGGLTGTASYMAPEQALGRPTGPSADVYSLGLVLLEALKGEAEYGGTPLEAALAHLDRPPVLPQGLPAELAGLLRAMTAQAPEVRPDARACARALADPRVPARPAHHASTARTRAAARRGGRAGLPRRTRVVAAGLAALGLTMPGALDSVPAGGGTTAARPAGHATPDHGAGPAHRAGTTAPAPPAPGTDEPRRPA